MDKLSPDSVPMEVLRRDFESCLQEAKSFKSQSLDRYGDQYALHAVAAAWEGWCMRYAWEVKQRDKN